MNGDFDEFSKNVKAFEMLGKTFSAYGHAVPDMNKNLDKSLESFYGKVDKINKGAKQAEKLKKQEKKELRQKKRSEKRQMKTLKQEEKYAKATLKMLAKVKDSVLKLIQFPQYELLSDSAKRLIDKKRAEVASKSNDLEM